MNRKMEQWMGIIALAVLSVVGCTVSEEAPKESLKTIEKVKDKSGPKAKEIVLQAFEKMKKTKGYHFKGKMTVEMMGRLMEGTVQGAHQNPDVTYYKMVSELDPETPLEMYRKGNKFVRKELNEWFRIPQIGFVSVGRYISPYEQFGVRECLENVRFAGEEKLNDKDCKIVEASINRKELEKIMKERSFPERPRAKITDSLFKVWIGTEDSLVYKLIFSTESIKKTDKSTIKTTVEMDFLGYDKDIVIEIPAEVKKLFGEEEKVREAGSKEGSPLACALLVSQTIKNAGVKAEALAGIAGRYAEAGRKDKASEILSQALKLTETIEDAKGKAKVLVEIGGKYVESGQKDKASKILSQALKLTETIADDSSRAWVLGEIASKYVDAGQCAQSLKVTKTIENPFEKVEALGEIAVQYVESGQYDQALKIVHTIQTIEIEGDLYDLCKGRALGEIAVKYAEDRQYDQALKIVKTIEANSYKAEALGEMAVKYAKAGQKDKASEILSQALQIANTIRFTSYKVEVLGKIAVNYAQAGLYDQAIKIAKAIKPIKYPREKTDALAKVAVKYAEAGQNERASEILSQALKIAKAIKHPTDKETAVCEIAVKYAEAGLYDQALQIAKATWPDYKVEVWGEIAVRYAKAGQKDKASELLSQALKIVKTMRVMYPIEKVKALLKLSGKYTEAGLKVDE